MVRSRTAAIGKRESAKVLFLRGLATVIALSGFTSNDFCSRA